MALKQANRLLNLATPLGDNELVLTGFDGDEGMSQLFRFTLQMISDNAAIPAKDILGKNVTFSIALADDSPRYFNGFVSRFSAGDEDENGRRAYTAEVVPWLWFLTRNSDSRIFQEMTVPQIIEQIFKDRGFTDYQPKISGSHPKREYCVQHQETDFNFVSRLMEEEGIFYYFEHDNGSHKLVLGDKASAYGECSQKEVDYPSDFGVVAMEDHLRSWEHNYEFRTGKFAQTDYNFETPSTSLLTNAKTVMKVPGVNNFEFFEYPGVYGKKGDGQSLADLRMEEEEAPHDVVSGAGIVRAFTPGGKFTVRQHRAASEEGKSFVITRLRHVAQESMGYETGGQLGIAYENSFQCIPDKVAYRPPRTTRKPRVQGVQTAIVVGPPGEEIFPDRYGRVKVQFHWDRYGKRDDKSSCWIRVAQVHAGKGFGGIDIPRIGDEVVVSFDDGDPDCPLITGRVYHAENMPPFPLPDSKTISGMKTKTYKGGGYNEMVMDDTPGNELIRIHGQYDQDATIEHDLREHVLNNRSRDVTNNETISIGVDRTETVGSNETLTVGINQTQTIGANRTMSIGANKTETVGANKSETVGSNKSVTVGSMQNETVGMMYNEMVGVAKTSSIGAAYALTVGAAMNTAVGVASFEEVGMTKKVIVGSKFEIVCGSSRLTMESGGKVTIEGSEFLFSATGNVKVKGAIIDLN
jgi:type VI secretion system secreted protein VgrG